MIRLLLLTTLLAGALQAHAHRFRVYPNRAIEILSIAESADGMLWLGASDGLYRFDGFRYRRIPDCPLPSVYFVALGSDGSIWVGGPGGLARYREGKFKTVNTERVLGLGNANGVVVAALGRRVVRVESDDSLRPLLTLPRGSITVSPSGRVWLDCSEPRRVCWLDPAKPEARGESVNTPAVFEQYLEDGKGRLWAAQKDRAVRIESGLEVEEHRRRPSQRTSRRAPLEPGRERRVWFLGETIRELASGETFDDGGALSAYQATAGVEDSRGRLWIAKLGLGLVQWTPDAQWQRWSAADFGGASPTQVARTRRGEIVAATRTNLFRLGSAGWTPLAAERRDYASILPLEDGGFLASVRKLGLVRLDHAGRIAERPAETSGAPDSYRLLVRDRQGRIWVGHKLALYRVDLSARGIRLLRQELPLSRRMPPDQAVDFDIDADGRLWCGYQHGVAWLDDAGQWQRIHTDQPVDLVRSIAGGRDSIWVGRRSAGPFLHLARAGALWNVSELAPADGYPPVDTHFIKRDRRGWIWRGSTEGVHVFEGKGEPSAENWLHLGRREGLAVDTTGQYGFFEDSDGSVWIAGEEGLAHIQPSPAWFGPREGALPPRVVSVEDDGAGNVRVDLGTFDAPEFRTNPIRYRVLPEFSEWRSGGATIELHGLTRGLYTLEAAYAGSEEKGPVMRYALQAGPAGAAWWQSLALPLAGGASAFLLVRRTRLWQRASYWLSKSTYLVRRRWQTRASGDPGITAASHAGSTLFGRYQLRQAISRGGFSVVYEGRDLENRGARVAVKVLRCSKPGQEGWLRGRFAQEVAALRSVRHESVVPVLDSWVSLEGEPCLAMPLLEGPTLRAVLDRGRMAPGDVTTFVRQIGSALAEVHRLGIVHRDLKPENLIQTGERWVIIDFGTAGLRAGGALLAATTLVSGSLAYMAPEQLTGHYSPASDVYSFGLLILEALTGKRLSEMQRISSEEGFTAELETILAAVVSRPDGAHGLSYLLSEAFRPEPGRRPADADAWAREIAELIERSQPVRHPA